MNTNVINTNTNVTVNTATLSPTATIETPIEIASHVQYASPALVPYTSTGRLLGTGGFGRVVEVVETRADRGAAGGSGGDGDGDGSANVGAGLSARPLFQRQFSHQAQFQMPVQVYAAKILQLGGGGGNGAGWDKENKRGSRSSSGGLVFKPLQKALFEVRMLRRLQGEEEDEMDEVGKGGGGDRHRHRHRHQNQNQNQNQYGSRSWHWHWHRHRHRHVIGLVDWYQVFGCGGGSGGGRGSIFTIITTPVAEFGFERVMGGEEGGGDADEFFLEPEMRRAVLRSAPGCLLNAVSFLHEQGICHGDLKLENLVVKDLKIIIVDFGSALEINFDLDGPRRLQCGIERPISGSLDIWCLGYIFLQIATVLHGLTLDDLEGFTMDNAMDTDGSFLKWIWYLWAWYASVPDGRHFHMTITDLCFLMLDPHPFKRPTAKQLLQLIAHSYKVIMNVSCKDCQRDWPTKESGTPPFATFRADRFAGIKRGGYPEDAMKIPVPRDWETARESWLAQYIHWGAPAKTAAIPISGKGKGKTKIETTRNKDEEELVDVLGGVSLD